MIFSQQPEGQYSWTSLFLEILHVATKIGMQHKLFDFFRENLSHISSRSCFIF